MELGIVGLPYVGKTTLFNALTRAHAAVCRYDATAQHLNRAAVHVQDDRLSRLHVWVHAKKMTPAMVGYVDIAGLDSGAVKSGVLSTDVVVALRATDALVHVVRAFRAVHVPHVHDTLDPLRDVGMVESELALSDLQIVENRLDRLVSELRARRDGALQREHDLLVRCRETLEEGLPLRQLALDPAEDRILKGFQFLTQKPLLLVVNIDERDIGNPEVLGPVAEWAGQAHARVVAICAEMEMELAQMGEDEAEAFRKDLGLEDESALARVVRESYALVDVITFFTAGDADTHAWTIPAGSTAVEAAGAVHSDMERGFIRAEVIGCEELLSLGTYGKAREAGRLRLEGKEYVVQDGDVVHVRFSV